MRTDTQRLDYVLTIVEQQDEEAADKLGAAYTLGFRGRVMVDAAMGARIIEPGQPMPELTALDLVGAELGRIRNVKGFSEERDDGYVEGELEKAAICYLLGKTDMPAPDDYDTQVWPWGLDTFKPSPDDRKKELTKGIALAVCELDRLIRAERRESLELQADVCREMSEAACAPAIIGIDLANGPDQCVVDGIAQPRPREFKVGDQVRIVKKAAGVGYAWDERMDAMIGSRGVIKEAAETPRTSEPQYRVGFWYYLADSLEHVDD